MLLTYAELPEDDVENVFDIHPPQEPAQCVSRAAQFLCRQFLTLSDDLDASSQRDGHILLKLTLAGPTDQAGLTGAEIALGELDQCCDQLRQTIASAPRYLE